ncbi:MAG TPA: metal-sulfur cluster assembly factor [Planctomycetaceae bacterium]|nr:metal-sulfur cluster assembly factor [Planctomycetaceae bacterium]
MATAEELIETLKQVIDPELMVNIVDLGLIYSVNEEDRKVSVEMTLTSPACPAGPQIVQQAKMALERLDDIDEAKVTITLSPPWTPDRMTDDARDVLGIF